MGKGRSKENISTAAQARASWNSSCDSILIDCLEKQKRNGRMTSNSSGHRAGWVEAEKALAGTEQTSGGGKKTAVSCQNRWTAVCSLNFFSVSCSHFNNFVSLIFLAQ